MKKIYHLATCNTCQRIIQSLNGGEGFELQNIKADKMIMHYNLVLGIIGLSALTFSCIFCCICGYYWIVRPYMKTMKDLNTSSESETLTTALADSESGVPVQIT